MGAGRGRARRARSLLRGDLGSWIAEHGPYLYHETKVENVGRILKEGLKPSDAEDVQPRWQGWYTPRPGHTYLGVRSHLSSLTPPPLRVDLRKLDHSRINPDEDWWELHGADYDAARERGLLVNREFPSDAFDVPEPRGDAGYESLGEWAQRVNLSDDAATLWSLQKGSVAYDGEVPPQSLSLNPEFLEFLQEESEEGEMTGRREAEEMLSTLTQ